MEIGRALEGELQGRQLANLKQNATDVENFPPREIPVGKTRDLAAKAAGFGKAFPRARGGHHGFNRQRCRLMARPVPSPFLGVQAAARACRPLAGGVVLLRPFTSASRHQGTCPK